MSDVGRTHIALPVTNMEVSLAFYAAYARMRVVHRRTDPDGTQVAWLSDRTRPFVIVLIQSPRVDAPLLPLAHLGVGCATRQEVDALCEQAQQAGCLRLGPTDSGYPIGYWAFLSDPDGHTLEIAYGQEVALTVAKPEQGKCSREFHLNSPSGEVSERKDPTGINPTIALKRETRIPYERSIASSWATRCNRPSMKATCCYRTARTPSHRVGNSLSCIPRMA